ncbi:MAG: LTA synthase family protein, partial [Muribaculaceae bacterium]|nr:LTA synthase family protein [Muribaculaceae bacterium]
VTVSTMNLSSAYFSPSAPLNHAAVNPLFSFMYSATHQSHFSDQFRFYPSQQEAESIYADLLRNGGSAAQDTLPAPRRPELSISEPDIYIVILESFSSYLMPSLGGDSVAMNLDSIARGSILFTDFYASSFRTDRSLPAILSGYPAQPTTSVMKYTDKTERMPSLPRSLASLGYGLEYYYGGDANFTNMKAFLVSAGFSTIISDKDFPVSERLSKWGVHDDRLFSLLTSRIEARPASASPMLTVIQTSSSHEPFEVPFSSSFSDPRLNAFAYTDHCVGQWINSLRADPERWRRALVIMLPDHWGVWPDNLPPGPARHRIPLIMTGGAIASPMPQRVNLTASQTDLAATVLAMLGHESDMPFSHDIFDPSLARSAFFSEPDLAALVAPTDTVVLNLATGEPSPAASPLAPAVKAYLQVLYTDLDSL